jgi:hypothetical protein
MAGVLDKTVDSNIEVIAELRELRQDVAALRNELRNALVCITQPDDKLSVARAADLVGRSEECVRNWIAKHRIGIFDPTSHRYIVFESKLRAFYLKKFGRPLPHSEN